jgi:beta-glucosidase
MQKISKALGITLIFVFTLTQVVYAQVYLDPDAPIGERVEDLLSRMTLEEKVGQMTQAERGQFNGNAIANIKNRFVGSILSGGGSSPGNNPGSWVDMYNAFQTQAMATRLGIPLIYGVDAVHGHNNVKGAVIFPHNIGLGCTGNPELVKECARITALEVSATGLDWTFSPCVTVPRNERWGRTYEGFGEEAGWVSTLSRAAVEGFQGDSLADKSSILACAKHYIADGGTTGGINAGNSEISEQELRYIHLKPFQSSIEAGVGSIMASFNQWNGSHCHGNKYLLTDILKDELAFEGFVLSDWKGINYVNGDFKQAIKQAINAGIDMAMQPDDYLAYQDHLKDLAQSGEVSMERIDDAVSRILRVKFEMGLFEDPFADHEWVDTVGCASHREVARQAVRESLVLLKNEGNILPLSKDIGKIALVGPKANNIGAQCGGWTISWQGSLGGITEGTTIRQAMEKVVGTERLVYTSSTNIPDADLAVVVVGENPYAEGAGDVPNGSISISAGEKAYIDAVKDKGLPMVIILLSGRPMIITDELDQSDAFLAAWLPGTEGDGIADVLFGDYAPTGKLTHSWPKSANDIPINVGNSSEIPLFEYGFGLTYEPLSNDDLKDEEPNSKYSLYPNPATDLLKVKAPQTGDYSLTVFDLSGKIILEDTYHQVRHMQVKIGALDAGTYLLKMSDGKRDELLSFVKQ